MAALVINVVAAFSTGDVPLNAVQVVALPYFLFLDCALDTLKGNSIAFCSCLEK